MGLGCVWDSTSVWGLMNEPLSSGHFQKTWQVTKYKTCLEPEFS
jgi:hypothetical protein